MKGGATLAELGEECVLLAQNLGLIGPRSQMVTVWPSDLGHVVWSQSESPLPTSIVQVWALAHQPTHL